MCIVAFRQLLHSHHIFPLNTATTLELLLASLIAVGMELWTWNPVDVALRFNSRTSDITVFDPLLKRVENFVAIKYFSIVLESRGMQVLPAEETHFEPLSN